MKKLIFAFLTSSVGFVGAQTLNDKGVYIDNDGELFNGTLTTTQEGVKCEFTVNDGVVAGPANYFYNTGQLMETGNFTNGRKDQKWVRYNEKGAVTAVAFYRLGKKDSTWLVYDDAGKKRFEMNYANGEKTGLWTTWDENGAVVGTKDYDKMN